MAPKDIAQPRAPRAGAVNNYLLLYNLISALLWTTLLFRTVQLWLTSGTSTVWTELNYFALFVETLQALEVLHAALVLVRASPLTTALQIAGRNTIVWAIMRNYPDVAAGEWAYSSLLVAWSLADVVRYSYFACEMGLGGVPGWLRWMRYNMFLVLYPPGILSECWLVYKVIGPSRERCWWYEYLLWFGLSLYIPASYILFSRMIAQRRKASRNDNNDMTVQKPKSI